MGTDLGTEVISGIASARDVTDYNTVLMQLAITMGLSIVVIVAFSVFRPRLKKIYAPKVSNHYHTPTDSQNKYHSKDSIEIPPPELSNSFFAWLTPVVQLKEKQMILNIGLDAVTFLRMLRMMLYILLACSVYGLVLFIIYLVYNLKYVPWVSGDTTKMETSSLPSPYRSTATIFTTFNITNISGGWVWPALGFTYVISKCLGLSAGMSTDPSLHRHGLCLVQLADDDPPPPRLVPLVAIPVPDLLAHHHGHQRPQGLPQRRGSEPPHATAQGRRHQDFSRD
jgi:hypothetical protein